MEAHAVASIVGIQQLAHRYSLAVDSRDMDLLVGLFVPDVAVGRVDRGRDALKRWYRDALRTVGVTIHMVGNHIVDLDGDADDRATGVVYCREEVEQPVSGEWRVGMIQYWDLYRRVDGDWLFERRRVRRWYSVESLVRPRRLDLDGIVGPGPRELAIPDSFPTWKSFWESSNGPRTNGDAD